MLPGGSGLARFRPRGVRFAAMNEALSAEPPASPDAGDAVDGEVLRSLAGARPWMLLCAILGAAGALLAMLGSATGLVALAAASTGMVGGIMLGMMAVYGLVGALALFPVIRLWLAGRVIARLGRSAAMEDLEAAAERVSKLWKAAGIFALCSVSFLVLAFFGAIGVSVFHGISR